MYLWVYIQIKGSMWYVYYMTFLASYWGSVGFYMHMSKKYNQDYDLTHKKVREINAKHVPTVLFNVHIATLPVAFVFDMFVNYKGLPFSWPIAIRDLALISITNLFTFYAGHRLFHTKYLYMFHKVHHELKRPTAMTSLYMHPIDFWFGNILPIYLPAFLLSSHPYTVLMWLIYSTTHFVGTHSIYCIGGHHRGHHDNGNSKYGVSVTTTIKNAIVNKIAL